MKKLNLDLVADKKTTKGKLECFDPSNNVWHEIFYNFETLEKENIVELNLVCSPKKTKYYLTQTTDGHILYRFTEEYP